jgi:hypothetical protein
MVTRSLLIDRWMDNTAWVDLPSSYRIQVLNIASAGQDRNRRDRSDDVSSVPVCISVPDGVRMAPVLLTVETLQLWIIPMLFTASILKRMSWIW